MVTRALISTGARFSTDGSALISTLRTSQYQSCPSRVRQNARDLQFVCALWLCCWTLRLEQYHLHPRSQRERLVDIVLGIYLLATRPAKTGPSERSNIYSELLYPRRTDLLNTTAKLGTEQYEYDSAPAKLWERTSRTNLIGHAESILTEIARCRRYLEENDVRYSSPSSFRSAAGLLTRIGYSPDCIHLPQPWWASRERS